MKAFVVAAIALGCAIQDPLRFTEKVDVARVLIDVRALDARGRPLTDLAASNFEVRIDGKPARVESAVWVTGALSALDAAPLAPIDQSSPPVAGRLIVLLFQRNLDRSRITGSMQMLLDLRGFLDSFTPYDRLAVLSFDSRLRLWLDFTADMNRVRSALRNNVLFGGPAPHNDAAFPSLRASLEEQRPDRSDTIESSLRLIANALMPLPGAKTIVLVGHGFAGRQPVFGSGGNGYDETSGALQRARVSVFCLDVTDADSHTLEAGLQAVAEDTGGFYARTHLFGSLALDRLASALTGQYVLIVERPDATRGGHNLEVKLKGRQGSVLAKNAYVD